MAQPARITPLFFLALLALTEAATAQVSNALLAGDYAAVQYLDDAEDGTSTALSALIFDGLGSGTFEILSSSIGDLGAGTFTYTVAENGAFTLDADDVSIQGVAHSTGKLFVMSELDANVFGIYVGLKKGTGLTGANLSGDYAAIQYFNDSVDGVSTAFVTLSFDGMGGGTFDVVAHSADDLSAGTLTYTVADDGAITAIADGSTIQGIFNPTAEGFAAVELDSEAFGLLIGARASSGQSGALLDGRYLVTRYVANGERSAEYAAMTFDGAGNGEVETLQASDGATGQGAFTYTVSDDGTFELLNAGANRGIAGADGTWFLWTELDPSEISISIGVRQIETSTAVDDDPGGRQGYAVQAHPSPATAAIVFSYRLPQAAHVRLGLYDVLGRRVADLVDGPQPPGEHTKTWDASALPSGVYFCRLSDGRRAFVRRVIVAR